MDEVKEAFNKLLAFVTELAKTPHVEYDEDHAGGGNFDDSYNHGSEVTRSRIAEDAQKILKEVQEILK